MKYLILMLLSSSHLYSQGICGLIVEKTLFSPLDKRLSLNIEICRDSIGGESILFDWGDGNIEYLESNGTVQVSNDKFIDYYFGVHNYTNTDTTYVELRLLNEIIFDEYLNDSYTDGNFVWYDSVYIYSDEYRPNMIFFDNVGTVYDPLIIENGFVSQDIDIEARGYESPIEGDYVHYSLAKYPSIGNMYPDNGEYLMENGRIKWNNISVAGWYGLASKSREFRFVDNSFYSTDSILLSTSTVSFSMFIDSSNISGLINDNINSSFSIKIYPNPTNGSFTISTEKEYIQNVAIYDFNGRIIVDEKINNENEISLNLRNECFGRYIVQVTVDDKIYSKIIFIEN